MVTKWQLQPIPWDPRRLVHLTVDCTDDDYRTCGMAYSYFSFCFIFPSTMHPPCPLHLCPPSPWNGLFLCHWTTTESQWQAHIFKYQLESRSERQGLPSHPWANLFFYAKADVTKIKTKWVMRWLKCNGGWIQSCQRSPGKDSILWERTRTLILDEVRRLVRIWWYWQHCIPAAPFVSFLSVKAVDPP